MAWIENRPEGTVRVVWRLRGLRQYVTVEDRPTAERLQKLVEGMDHQIDADLAYRRLFGLPDTASGPRPLTLDEWAAKWFPAKTGVQIDTVERYQRIYELHISPIEIAGVRFGAYPLPDITAMTVRTWIATLRAGGRSAVLLHRAHAGVLHQMLRDAVIEKHIPENPAAHAVLPRDDEDEDADDMVVLTHEDAALLFAAQRSQLGRDVVATLLGTGVRWSELTALQPRDLDFKAATPTARIQRVWKHSRTKGWYLGAPKSKRSRRTLPLSASVAEVLERRSAGHDPMSLVFASTSGQQLNNSNFRRDHWNPAVLLMQGWRRRGRQLLPVPRAPIYMPSPTPHDLRHTYASWLIHAGWPLTRVSQLLGHRSTSFTEHTYVHQLPGHDPVLLAGFEKTLSGLFIAS